MTNKKIVMLCLHDDPLMLSLNEWHQLEPSLVRELVFARESISVRDGELWTHFHSIQGLVGPYRHGDFIRYDSLEVDRALST